MIRATGRTIAAFLAAFSLNTQPVLADQLTVDIVGVRKTVGALMVAVYDSVEAWESKSRAAAERRHEVTGDSARLVFADLPGGAYAIMLYHDENSNGVLDSNMLGIPSEAYGFSNDGGRLAKPTFKDAEFVVDGDTLIQIRIR